MEKAKLEYIIARCESVNNTKCIICRHRSNCKELKKLEQIQDKKEKLVFILNARH